MDSTAVIVVVAASIVGPTLLSVLTAWQRRTERQEDYARQDAVAKAAEDRESRQEVAAHAVAEQARETVKKAAELLLAANERVATQSAAASEVINGKLGQIHELVNSTLTGAMQAELVARQAQVELVRRFTPSQTAEIAVLESAVADLQMKLTDRIAQTKIADAQVVSDTS